MVPMNPNHLQILLKPLQLNNLIRQLLVNVLIVTPIIDPLVRIRGKIQKIMHSLAHIAFVKLEVQ
jgi:hypothetical protein